MGATNSSRCVPPDYPIREGQNAEMPFAGGNSHAVLHIHQHRSDKRSNQSTGAILIELRSLYDCLLQCNQDTNTQNACLAQKAESLRRDNQALIQSLADTQCRICDLRSAQAVQQHRVESLTAQRDRFEEELVSLRCEEQTWTKKVNKLIDANNTIADELTRTLYENDELLRQVHKLRLMRDIKRHGRQQQEYRVLELEKTLQAQSQAERGHRETTQFMNEEKIGHSVVARPVTSYDQNTDPNWDCIKVDRGAKTNAGSIAVYREPREQTLNKKKMQMNERRRAKHSFKPPSRSRKKPTQHSDADARREAVFHREQRRNNDGPNRFNSSPVNQVEVKTADDDDTIVVYTGP